MTSTQIVSHLADEFSVRPEHIQSALEMLDAGLRAPFIGRVRRVATGGLSEGAIRRLTTRREELEELERRRGTILRALEGEGGVPRVDGAADESTLERIRTCMDRFELEDLFLPFRRPEPEVQLALDRGLGRLADELVAPLPRELRSAASEAEVPDEDGEGSRGDGESRAAEESAAMSARVSEASASLDVSNPSSAPETSGAEHAATASAETAVAEPEPEPASEPGADTVTDHGAPDHVAPEHGAAEGAAENAPEQHEPAAEVTTRVTIEGLTAAEEALLHGSIEVTPELARVCEQYVSPDRGLHTAQEVLAGAMRILSDRLGRNPRLRGTIRRMLRKNGVLSVRATVDESRLGRHRPLTRIRQPLRQIQGHKLIAIRQAQKERVVTTSITLDRHLALPKVRAALGAHTKPEFQSVLEAVALRTLEHRLLPLIEADVRLELKERADDEALRFLAQHLREVLLASPLGRRPVAGIDVSAKGDWTIALLDEDGAPRGAASGGPTADGTLRIEVGEKDAAALGAELGAALQALDPRPLAFAVGHSKLSRAGLPRIRAALRAIDDRTPVVIVNDSGLTTYTNSDLARAELAELAVPQRAAVSLGRRLQDPLSEILKVDPKHLGLGPEQGLVSKANLRRTLDDTLESCAALVGCDVNRAPLALLEHLPGLDPETARKLIARRAERRIASREELRTEGLLSEVQWINAIAFLRVPGSDEPLDRTSLHPEQYDAARRVLESSGGSVAENLGKPGVTKGLRRADFQVEETLWRDLMRELWHPGRDPRPPLHLPRLLSHDTDRVTLTRDRVIEGVVSNVASFGAFVDIGLEQDGLVHVSEISDRYVRDARELVAIGQCVRLRVLDGQASRVALSLKHVPEPERPPRPEFRRDRPQRGDRRDGGRFEGRERFVRDEPKAPVRAATSRRDGLVPGARKEKGRGFGKGPRGGPGGGHGGGPGGGGGRPGGGGGGRPPFRGGPRDREERGEGLSPQEMRELTARKAINNPFASFFKREPEPEAEPQAPPSQPVAEPIPEPSEPASDPAGA